MQLSLNQFIRYLILLWYHHLSYDSEITFRLHNFQVFEISALQIFSPTELDYLLCGRKELWKVMFCFSWTQYSTVWSCMMSSSYWISFLLLIQAETLVDHIKFDHGYTAKSPAIVYVSLFFSCQWKCSAWDSNVVKVAFISLLYWLQTDVNCLIWFWSVIRDHGRVHSWAATSILSVRDWCSPASSRWSGRAQS